MVEGAGATPNRRAVLKLMGCAPVVGYRSAVPPRGDGSASRHVLPPPAAAWDTSMSVALAGDTALVGSPPTRRGTAAFGTARFFTRSGPGRRWRPTATLSGPSDGEQFGATVALDGATALVGSPLGGVADVAGRVTVLRRRGGRWRRGPDFRREGTPALDQFGATVALDGATAAVGAPATPGDFGFGTGSVTVFVRRGEEFIDSATLTPPAGVDGFGSSLALDGDTLVVGGRDRDASAPPTVTGTVCVYVRTGRRWRLSNRITSGGVDDGFGTSLAVDGDTLWVGAPTETNAAGTNAGSVSVFARTASGWGRETVLRGEADDDQFGTGLAVDGGRAVVASRAAAAPIAFHHLDGRWVDVERLDVGRRTPARTPTAVALDGPRTLVGVAADGNVVQTGTVVVFER